MVRPEFKAIVLLGHTHFLNKTHTNIKSPLCKFCLSFLIFNIQPINSYDGTYDVFPLFCALNTVAVLNISVKIQVHAFRREPKKLVVVSKSAQFRDFCSCIVISGRTFLTGPCSGSALPRKFHR